jgi:hypothetical protein
MPTKSETDRRERLELSGFPRLFALAFEAWANTLAPADRRNADARFAQAIGVNPKTPANWRNAVSAPPKKTWDQAARLLAPHHATGMVKLGAAWGSARGREVARTPKGRAAAASETRFEPLRRQTIDAQVLDFAVAATQGSTASHIELASTLDFGESPCEVDGVRFTLAVRRAKLLYEAPGCEPKPGTKYQRAPRCVVEGAAWVFTATNGAVLRGPQLGGEALVVLSTSGDEAEVTFRVQCDDESAFEVTVKPKEATLPNTTERAAAHFLKLKTCPRQPDGTYHIATAGLSLKPVKR